MDRLQHRHARLVFCGFDVDDDFPRLAAGHALAHEPPDGLLDQTLLVAEQAVDGEEVVGADGRGFGVPSNVSEHLIASDAVRKVSFTGSVPVGKHLAGLAAKGMKRVTMELGGHSPVVVFADADPEKTADTIGAFKYRKEIGKIRGLMDKVFDVFPRLRDRVSQNAGTLSGGEQQMLALGRAMMSEPHLVCLDEPSLGLAPKVVQDIFGTIKTINAAGTSVLLVEQNARYALETASRGYVLQTGSIIANGACAALRNDDRVRQAYLGRSAAEQVKL